MSDLNTSSLTTGADLICKEDNEVAKAQFLARMRVRQATLELELANLAAALCSGLQERLDTLEERVGR
jgi:hypothetical protein